VSLREGAFIGTSTEGSGRAGDIEIKALDAIELNGASNIGSQVCQSSEACGSVTGNGGNLTLLAEHLLLHDGSRLDTSTFGVGRAGDIKIEALDIELTGSLLDKSGNRVLVDESGNPVSSGAPITTGIFTQVAKGAIANAGNAGDITIKTERLTATKGGQVSSATFGGGNGGRVSINASNSIKLNGEALGATKDVGKSGIFASAEPGATGDAGALDITTQELTVDEQAEISVRNFGRRAGNLVINADSVILNQGRLTARTEGEGGANIVLRGLDLLQMQNRSLISAEALNNANGGNITIDVPNGFVIAAPHQNNDIVASAERGEGGDITITTQSIFGLEEREAFLGNTTNDIDASSEFGFQGTVNLNTLEIDPTQGLVELPLALAEEQLAQGCQVAGGQTRAEFFNTGRGGLSPTPYESLSSSDVLDDVRIPRQATAFRERNTPSASNPKSPESIVEAQGWVMSQEGTVLLVAEAPDTEFQSRCNLH